MQVEIERARLRIRRDKLTVADSGVNIQPGRLVEEAARL